MLSINGADRKIIEERLNQEKIQLRHDIEEAIQLLTASFPPEMLTMSLGQFLQLQNLLEEALALTEGSSNGGGGELTDNTRKMTTRSARRTMSLAANRKESIAPRETLVVPPTPQFHPGLPETPAMLRKRRRGRESMTSNIFVDKPSLRVTRTTIRPSNVQVTSNATSRASRVRQSDVGAVVSVELNDGKCVDVDLAASPSKLVANLGVDAIREMKDKMQAYANQIKSFFKRLKVAK